MSHIWSPLAVPVIRRAGVRHVVIVHDADRHPGDRSGLVIDWVMREAARADHVVTLTEAVARRLTIARGIPERKITVLFHPDLTYGSAKSFDTSASGPLRVLFFGRILPYKGLDLLVAAIERLRHEGLAVEFGVFGRGEITPDISARLSALGAEVENRWLHHNEFESILSRYELVVAPHIEASQSGVIAAAFGSCLPVVATPVGGLIEQVTPDVTGVIADSVSVDGLSNAIRKVAKDRAFLARLQRGVAATRGQRSMERFFDRIAEIALGTTS
jgi:glycosyltransferase involved in cell wall biosynthesis